MTTTFICFGPEMREAARHPVGVRWCFHCRHRREFTQVVLAPVDRESWYPTSVEIQCAQCRTVDGDLFPGHTREWDEP
jgi:hypothetical protein